jgi:prepilin-type N-terminal cleavage/methylation domain-containing protein/prepilin-type processing-associated H-X9-DG protein
MHKRQAFTLIELLVVIAIIAVLMAVLVPSLKAARDQAKGMQCAANIRTLAMAWSMYKDDNGDRIVSAMTHTVGSGTAYKGDWVRLADNWNSDATLTQKQAGIRAGALWTYTGQKIQVYRCPSDRRIKLPKLLVCRSFSIPDGANGEGWPSGACVVAKKYGEIKQTSAKYVFIEDFDNRGDNQNSWTIDFVPNTPRFIDPVAIWHSKKSSFGFADGHTELRKWQDRAFLDWCDQCLNSAMYQAGSFTFSLNTNESTQNDYRFLSQGFPCKSRR